MGDTAQVHFLTTSRDDEFVGTTQAWNADSLIFITQSNVRIAFDVAAVKSIEVLNGLSSDIVSTKIFVLKTKEGGLFYGYPTRIHPDKISFFTSSAGIKRFKPNQVASIYQTSTMSLILEEPFTNSYTLKAFSKKKEKGELVSYDGNSVAISNDEGMRITAPLNKINVFEINPMQTPYRGYGRSLMYLQTGFNMEAGSREYRNIMLGINIVSIGVTDHFSMAVGLVTILPYADFKLSKDIGKYVHYSAGAYLFVPFSGGIHGAVSLGTPDYFLNLSYLRNFDIPSFDTDSKFESFGFGASIRIGPRSRFFAEYNIMPAPSNNYGYDSFYEKGYGNAFTWGYGWFKRRFRLETGVTEIGPFVNYYCDPTTCDKTYHTPIPFFSFSYIF